MKRVRIMEKIRKFLGWMRQWIISDKAIDYVKNNSEIAKLLVLLSFLGFLIAWRSFGLIMFFGLVGAGVYMYGLANKGYRVAIVDVWVVVFAATPLALMLAGYLLMCYIVEIREEKGDSPPMEEKQE